MPATLPFERSLLASNGGLVTARDPSTLEDGDLTVATACEYHIGSPHVYKQPGRSLAGTIAASKIVRQLHQLQYDAGSTVLAAYVGTTTTDGAIYESTPGTSLTFGTSTLRGIDALLDGTATPHFSTANDRWVMCNGVNSNYIRDISATSSEFGTHTPAGTHLTILTDSTKAWLTDQWVGWTVRNVSTGNTAVVTANTATTLTVAAITSGFTQNDIYQIEGRWRLLGMQPAIGVTLCEAATDGYAITYPTNDATEGGYSAYQSSKTTGLVDNATNAYDASSSSFAYGVATPTVSRRVIFTFAAGDPAAGRWITVIHGAGALPPINPDTGIGYGAREDEVESSRGRHVIEYSIDSGTTWRTITDRSGVYHLSVSRVLLPATAEPENIRIRATTTLVDGTSAYGRLYEVFLTSSGTGALKTTTNTLYYAVTERFTDGAGIVHESRANEIGSIAAFTNKSSVRVYLPGSAAQVANPCATHFVIYRSVDEPGGGYPLLWEIGTIRISDTIAGGGSLTYFTDYFVTATDLTVTPNTRLYDVINVLYPDGSALTFPLNDPPPKSRMSIPYQGAMCYLPVDVPNKLWYSVAGNTFPAGIERVPACYCLNFVTGSNDTLTSAALANGGRSLIAYFPAYAMLVNYLPQANDPGVFDTRVREYVSETRGAAGTFCATSFTLPTGATLAAACDTLGIWVTDGVSGLNDWTRNLNWATLMSGVNLATAKLVNNPSMSRLELLYVSGSTRYELHLFYGEMREGNTPRITGPHVAGTTYGWLCKHYALADVATPSWLGWSGSAYADGKVFCERQQALDASYAYDGAGVVPYRVDSGERYLNGLGSATVLELSHPKFADPTVDKAVTIVGTFRRDGNAAAVTATKSFTIGSGKKLYWHRYADRLKMSVRDLTATALPAFVAHELYTNPAGMSKE